MNILLINPKPPIKVFNYNSLSKKILARMFSNVESLAISILEALTPDEHTIKIINESYSKIDFNKSYDLVGITVLTPSAPHAYEIADEFRENGTTVVLGGWHPSICPKEAKEHADSIVIGEAEKIWPKLLMDHSKKKLKAFYKNNEILDLKYIPPRYKSKRDGLYFLEALQTTRGCPNRCTFCNMSTFENRKFFRKRPINSVIEEIKRIKQKNISFYDPSLTIDTDYTKKLFRKMKNLNKNFSAFGNVHILGKDEELLKAAYEAGCKRWFVGFDSISQLALNTIGKKSNKVNQYFDTVKKIHEYDMTIIGAFIFGFDTDTKKIFKNTIDSVNHLNIDIPEFTILTPYPGTGIYKKLLKENRILTHNWKKYTETGNVVFKPKNMSPEELLDGTERVTDELYSYKSIFNRVLKKDKDHLSILIGNVYQSLWYKKS